MLSTHEDTDTSIDRVNEPEIDILKSQPGRELKRFVLNVLCVDQLGIQK